MPQPNVLLENKVTVHLTANVAQAMKVLLEPGYYIKRDPQKGFLSDIFVVNVRSTPTFSAQDMQCFPEGEKHLAHQGPELISMN